MLDDFMDEELEKMKKEVEFLTEKNELQQQIDKLKNSMAPTGSPQQDPKAPQNSLKNAPKTMLFIGIALAVIGAVLFVMFGQIVGGMGLDMLGAVLIGLWIRFNGGTVQDVVNLAMVKKSG